MSEEKKSISISGTNNKYQINKLLHKEVKNEPRKRVVAKKWCFADIYFEPANQLKMVNDILKDEVKDEVKDEENVPKIAIQQINKKITGYKQQDIIKKKLDPNKFITFE